MTFKEFLSITQYTEVYASHCLLYMPNSRPSKMAKNLGFEPTEEERKHMIKVKTSKKYRDCA